MKKLKLGMALLCFAAAIQAQDVEVFPQQGPGLVAALACSPDGRYIVSFSLSGAEIVVWDAESGRELRRLKAAGGGKRALVLDGTRLFSGHVDGIRSWDIESGRELGAYPCPEVNALALVPGGRRLVSGSADGLVRVWDIESKKLILALRGHNDAVLSLALSPDGRRIYSGSYGIIRIWDAGTGAERGILAGQGGQILSLALSPDGKRLYSASDAGTIKVWNTEIPGKQHPKTIFYDGYAERNLPLLVSGDGKTIIFVSLDFLFDRTAYVHIWDADSLEEKGSFAAHTDYISSLAFTDKEDMLVSGSWDGQIKIWDLSAGPDKVVLSKTLSGNSLNPRDAAFSPDGKTVDAVTGMGDNLITLSWNLEEGRLERSVTRQFSFDIPERDTPEQETFTPYYYNYSSDGKIASENSSARAASPDNTIFATGSVDGTVTLYTVDTGLPLWTLNVHNTEIFSLEFSADGLYLMSHSDVGIVCVADVKSGKPLITTAGGNPSFSPDGRRIMIRSTDKYSLWDITTGKEIASFIGFTDGEWVVITPDGYYNASLNGDKYLNVRVGGRVYGIDQYRRQFYRPDIVRIALSGDAYQDAVREAGVSLKDAAAFVPPDIAILSIKEGQVFSAPGMELSVAVTDPNREIIDVWVVVNGVLAAGKSASRSAEAAELAVTGRDKQLSFTIPVVFEDGENTIEVFASNGIAEGWASVNCTAQVPLQLPDLWILAIGVNRYESPRLQDLSWAVNDAEELVEVFKSQEGKRYGKVNARILVDGEERPTARRVRESFSWFGRAQSRDLCILFIAGHAVNDEKGDYYFLPADAVFGEDGGLEGGTAISYTEINAVLDMPGRKLFFLDTCHSAGAGKTRRADASSFMRQAKEYYPVIFSSSRGNEESLESEEYRHGLFTWSLIQGLNGEARGRSGSVTMKSLDSFVSDLVNELSGGKQNPITTTPNGYDNFIVAE